MKTKLSLVLAAGLLLGSGLTAHAQTVGDWVLGNYQGAGYWYPGVIETLKGGKITIRYDDNERETLAAGNVRPYNWKIGSKVECDFKGKGDWYGGTIFSLAGEKLGITYDDGERETTKTGRCRSN